METKAFAELKGPVIWRWPGSVSRAGVEALRLQLFTRAHQ